MKKLLLSLSILASLCACNGKEPVTPDKSEGPKLESLTPTEGTELSVGAQKVVLLFNENVKCTTADKAKVTLTPSGTIDAINAYNNEITVNLTLEEWNTEYVLTFPSGTISGFRDNPTDKAIAVRFRTKEEDLPPATVDPDEIPVRGSGDEWKMAEKLALGFNFGNQMDAYYNDVANETVWGNPKATQQAFDKLKSYGFSSVRIPITWMGHIGDAPDYKIEDAWMNRVAEIVGYAEKAGLMCIINTHHDENHNAGPAHWQDIKGALASKDRDDEIRREINAVWTQIAEKFRDKGDWLIFESFNEINDGGWGWSDAFRKNPQAQYDILNAWNQVFVDAVRATGGNNATRWLGIPGYCANIQFTLDGLVLPKDSAKGRLMVAVHSYDPSSFCGAGTTGQYDQWGHTGAAGMKPTEDERALRSLMASLYAKYIANGIPCYIGECGCVNKKTETGAKFQKYYLEYFAKAARCFGLPCMIWDNGVAATDSGEAFGYVNHGTGEYIGNGASVIPAMAKAQNNVSDNYTLESIYNNAPKL